MAARRKKTEPVAPAAVVVAAPAPLAAPASVSLSRDLGVVGEPCDPACAAPLRVTATLRGPVVSVPGLDSLLAYAVALLAGREPLTHGDAGPLVEIPILREPAGRFHLCSAPVYAEAHYETRHRNRRFPMVEAQMLAAPDVRRINIPALEHKQVHSLIYDIMNDKQRKDFEEFLETDFSFEVPGEIGRASCRERVSSPV